MRLNPNRKPSEPIVELFLRRDKSGNVTVVTHTGLDEKTIATVLPTGEVVCPN